MEQNTQNGLEIAIIGMSCRFPGAENTDVFWENLKNGKESISIFSDEELKEAGIDSKTLMDPSYVKAGGNISETEWFDLNVFDYSPKEAELMDPQLKILHECAWEALEQSGYASNNIKELVGTYIGCSTNLYWVDSVFRNAQDFLKEAELLSGSQFFSTRISHKLNLKGPSYTVQTACSSSLVAVHLACQALLSGDCDMSLAGGVSLTLPEKRGYWYQDGMILSPDGRCKPFDEKANGTVNGNGAGIVVLKRLEDAIADRDFIHAVIKGSAINNDGRDKVSFTAPSVEGQAEVIKAAHQMAEVKPESISYIEAHGTGTKLGDPIEIEALKLAFSSEKRGFCAVGSVKSNIGHLDNAAGIAGLIKTVQSLKYRMIPPSINYSSPNRNINFDDSPFYINTKLKNWENNTSPLRAGVSSFGMGGTNAHIVLEEAPIKEASGSSRKHQIICLSAQTKNSLKVQTNHLISYLQQENKINLGDISYTLLKGKKNLKHRRMLVVSNQDEAVKALQELDPNIVYTGSEKVNSQTVFMFPGQGTQYVNMGLNLYEQEEIFRNEIDKCFQVLKEINGSSLKEILYPIDMKQMDPEQLNQTSNTQPIIFIFEYALAKTLMKWGIKPASMIGHSLGEYVAACLSGVFTLSDALKLVYERSILMQSLPSGSMVSIMASVDEIKSLISKDISIAAVNGERSCVISGTFDEISIFTKKLQQKGYQFKKLATSHAFHSTMMDPILDTFKKIVEKTDLNNPKIPYLSNVTGEWITDQQATSPTYWVDHLRNTVNFSKGLSQLTQEKNNVFIEVGPGRTLSTFLRQEVINTETPPVVVNTVRHPKIAIDDAAYLLQNIGKLYINGVKVDWSEYYSSEKRNRIPLPTYPFDRKYYSIYPHNEHASKQSEDDNNEVDIDETNTSSMMSKLDRVIEAYRMVTGVRNVSFNDDFFEIGGSSLSAVNVVTRLQKDFHISINHLFEHPRANDLAEKITFKKADQINKEALSEFLINRGKRNQLDDEKMHEIQNKQEKYETRIRAYEQVDLSKSFNYKNIFLTGSTGYLGVYLLRDLLIHSKSNVHLLIRSKSNELAQIRIKEKVTSYFGEDFYNKYCNRLYVHSGDLTKQTLGLNREKYTELSELIECVIHSAGDVSHYGVYQKSFNANVLSTSNLIEFCFLGKKKDFNHVSTLAVASGELEGVKDTLYTEYDHDLGQIIPNPYPKTKLEAEKIILSARANGLNINIYRIGNIVFDSSNGRFQENIEQNAIYTMLKAYMEIGLVPEMERDTDFTCVDDVSMAIVSLFDKKALMNETHHIFNPEYISFSDLLTTHGLNVNVSEIALEGFIDYIFDEKQIEKHALHIYNLQLHSVGEELASTAEVDETIFHITAQKTNNLLKKVGFEWHKIDVNLANKMIEYGRKVGFF